MLQSRERFQNIGKEKSAYPAAERGDIFAQALDEVKRESGAEVGPLSPRLPWTAAHEKEGKKWMDAILRQRRTGDGERSGEGGLWPSGRSVAGLQPT